MWFGFGLITAVLAFVFAIRARLMTRWRGMTCRLPGEPGVAYEYQEIRSKKRVTKVRIGVSAPEVLNFRVREEGKRDAFFKWLGVSEEMQTSDSAFDERLYLESDAIAVHFVFRKHLPLRASILKLFNLAGALGMKGSQLRCANGRLWIEFKPDDAEVLDTAQGQLVPELEAIATALRQHRLDADNVHDPFVWRAAALLAVSTATAVLGGLGLARGLIGRTDILDPWSLFVACIPIGLILLAAFMLLILVVLGRSSRTHIVLMEVAIVGAFGFVTGSFALAREANIELDRSNATRHEVMKTRVEHRITRRKRGRRSHSYYLYASDWRANRPGSVNLKITIDDVTYKRLKDKGGAIVVTRKGALGYEWIESITAAETTSDPW